MVNIDCALDKIMKERGIDPTKPAKWKQDYYISKADPPIGGKRKDGWYCSKCGKKSYVRTPICSGCNSKITNEETDNEQI